MILEMLTPEKKLFSGEARSVQLPGTEGLFEILDNHAPIIAALGKGAVKVLSAEGEKKFDISGGFVECLNNKVILCVEA
jgi:F-type H+-transporting ATPase subunit epsilon